MGRYKVTDYNEYDAGAKWRMWGNTVGLMTRIENIGASLPDIVHMSKGLIVFNELKIARSGKIKVRPFQWSMAIKARHDLHPYQWLFVVYDNVQEAYLVFTINQLKSMRLESREYGLYFDVTSAKPLYIVKDYEDFKGYISELEKLAFGD
ncbi:MAG: hypothetical protein M3P33_04080 [bacterium]|nr:hypothetical protein [bacterium]